MSSDTFNIKYKDHFVLFIGLKDKIVFEAELSKNNIVYHTDDNQSTLDSSARYFLLDENKVAIDRMIIDKGIIASTGSIRVGDYSDGKKVMKLYGVIVGVITILIILIALMFD